MFLCSNFSVIEFFGSISHHYITSRSIVCVHISTSSFKNGVYCVHYDVSVNGCYYSLWISAISSLLPEERLHVVSMNCLYEIFDFIVFVLETNKSLILNNYFFIRCLMSVN